MRATLLLVACAVACAGCATRLPVTQGFIPSGNTWVCHRAGQGYDGSFCDNQLVQVFTPRASGTLLTAALYANRDSGDSPLCIRVTETEDGLPSRTLGEVLVDAGRVPHGRWKMGRPATVVVDFSPASVRLRAGRPYALVFSTRVPGASYDLYGGPLPGATTSDERRGPMFRTQNGRVFETGIPVSLFMELAIRPACFSRVHRDVAADPPAPDTGR